MARANNAPAFYPTPVPKGFVEFWFPFSYEINAIIKQYPGVFWGPTRKLTAKWFVPRELQTRIARDLSPLGLGYPSPVPVRHVPMPAPDGVRPWQRDVLPLIEVDNGLGIYWEPGIGKSLAMLLGRKGRTLGFATSIRTMVDEIKKWLPGVSYEVYDVNSREAPKPGTEIVVTSYSMLKAYVEELSRQEWGTLIFDEAHHIKNYKAKTSKYVKDLRTAKYKARVIIGTATPQGTEFQSWYQYTDLIWPGRFGSASKFLHRYGVYEKNDLLGRDILKGLNPIRAPELNERIAEVGHRLVKSDPIVRDYMPTLDVQASWIDPPSEHDWRSLAFAVADAKPDRANGSRGDVQDDLLQRHMNIASDHKVMPTAEETIALMEAGVPKILTVGYYVSFVEQIAKVLKKPAQDLGYTVIHTARGGKGLVEALKNLRQQERVVFVPTMASIWESANDFTDFTHAVFGECYYDPVRMEQLLGRLARLGGVNATAIFVLMRETLDEHILACLRPRIDDANALCRAGRFGEAFNQLVAAQAGEDYRITLAESIRGGAWRID